MPISIRILQNGLAKARRTCFHLLTVGLNGSYRLTAKTVKTVNDDASVDSLFGEAGLDWFFARTGGKTKDKVNDKSSGEVVTALS